MIEVFLATALICFEGECYPALVGSSTPRGEFVAERQVTRLRGYGGEILTFKETATDRFAIHRTWPGRERLYANASVYRRSITNGCINVQPEVYARLRACCDGAKVVIQ